MTYSKKIAVVVASLGRPQALRILLEQLQKQTLPADQIILSLESENDCPDLDGLTLPIEIVYVTRGLPAQRNRGLDLVETSTDFVAFLDDDYIPSISALEGMITAFNVFPKASGLGGQLLADGAQGPGIEPATAIRMVEAEDVYRIRTQPKQLAMVRALYGCNMVFRLKDIGAIRFDEELPLYGWLEDADFTARVPGEKIYTDAFFGVHCAVKQGREKRGERYGYSQIANPIYMWRKGTLSILRMISLILRPFLSNIVKSLKPEPWIDRAGRLRGNLIALSDLFKGRLNPKRILEFK
jgi:GT2 family glycosyltransferase